jgi:hypothetical protein
VLRRLFAVLMLGVAGQLAWRARSSGEIGRSEGERE